MKFKLSILILIPGFLIALTIPAYAATTPDLGQAASFGILSGTYTNTAAGTTINGDLGYTTPPAVTPTVNGTTHIADGTYNQAGIDQNAALGVLNAQPCDFNFGSPTDLSLESQPLTPGVYCIAAAASIGTGGITLSGSGTYLFRIDGALTTVANSAVTLDGGASECDVFWTPTSAATLGANSTFVGTVIDAADITVGSTVNWQGRALGFGGTVTTDTDTITAPTCGAEPSSSPSATPISSPTPSPSASAAVSSANSTSGSSSSTNGPSVCVSSGVTTTPNITEARRVSPNSIFVSWSSGPLNDFVVHYGFENGVWLYSTNVSGTSTTINDLPANQSIWIQVAATDNCAVGSFGPSVLVGGTPQTNSPGFPNAGGSPRLPNAGINPESSLLQDIFYYFLSSRILNLLHI